MIGAWILAQLGRFWLPLTLLGLIASGWVAFAWQTHRLGVAVQEREQFAERERQARVAAFDDAIRQRRISEDVKREYAERAQAADARASAIADRLRRYLAARPVRDPAAAPGTDGAPREPESLNRLGQLLAGVVEGCSRDAVRLGALQEWAERVTSHADR